ncbi:universal stress protein [Streptomyces sp. Da 82-17]|uniref:universal stress protein n=1 Tax=Streptomyces sp. Da 82-17 TaxID=3377116 RepID=UPI0038D5150D
MTAQVAVGVDGSQESLAAARWAAREAELRKVPLRLVRVAERPGDTAELPYDGDDCGGYDRDGRAGAAVLREAEAWVRAAHPGVEVFTGQALGRAGAELTAAANESDLLVLGSRGLDGLRGFLLGSVSLRVAGAARRPVALVRAGARGAESGGEILVGVDLIHPCDALLAFAFAVASRGGRSLHFLNCWTLPPSYGRGAPVNPGLVEDMCTHRVKGLGDLLEPWRRRYPEVGTRVESVLGGASGRLVTASTQASLVVVGRRTTRTPSHLGHVAHALLHHSPVGVAVVPVR